MRKIVSSLMCLWLTAPVYGQDISQSENLDADYVDRVIASNQLSVLEDEDQFESYDDSGLPRGWKVELGSGISSNKDSTQHDAGISVAGDFETANYGAWSFEVDANRNNAGQNVVGRLTVFQRGLILGQGWSMDNSLGTLGTPMPSMLRQQYRFVLPTPALLGISSVVKNNDGRVITAALGRAGSRTAGRFSNFDTSGGNILEVGGQTRNGPVQAAATIISSEDNNGQSQTSAAAAIGWSVGSNAIQGNVLVVDNGSGIWLDGISKPERIEHRYGIFRFDPLLQWAGLNTQSDVQGVYYRAASRQARWIWSGGVDHVQSVSDALPDTDYFTAEGRYQLTSRWGIGGAASVRFVDDSTSTSLQALIDKKTAAGSARIQIEQARTKELRSEQISWDQSFANADSLQWSAKLGVLQQHDRFNRSGREWSATVYGSRDLGSRLRWDGMLKYSDGVGLLAQTGIEANLGLNLTINQSWSLSATYFQNQGRRDPIFNLDPLLTLDKIDQNDRAFFFTLRYEHRAGQAVGIIGGAAGSGAGSIVGEIYLDANADGLRNADEIPVADITVLLDGRYPARTDSNGRFSFNRVAAGKHTLATDSDNLPLPWQLPNEVKTVEVKVRDTTRLSVGALQPTK